MVRWSEGANRDGVFAIFANVDRVYRGANARNAVAGTGIGLSVSRDIMEASGGAITVSNTPSGVAFVIGMPVRSRVCAM